MSGHGMALALLLVVATLATANVETVPTRKAFNLPMRCRKEEPKGSSQVAPTADKTLTWKKCLSTQSDASKLESECKQLEERLRRCKGLLGGMFDANHKRSREHVLGAFIDLDHCALFGTDGNDLGIAWQLNGKTREELTNLYTKLINPNVKALVDSFRRRGLESDVVVYTRRSHLLRYCSRLRARPVRLRWDASWHHSPDQVVIPRTVTKAEDAMQECSGEEPLAPSELRDLRMGVERLLAARDALARILSLKDVPEVVVTSTTKNVTETAKRMGFSSERSFLWDDNAELRGQDNVFIVDRYDHMPTEARKHLLDYLEAKLPARSLSKEAVDFMLCASKDSACVEMHEDSTVRYCIREGPPVRPFGMPDIASLGQQTAHEPQIESASVPSLQERDAIRETDAIHNKTGEPVSPVVVGLTESVPPIALCFQDFIAPMGMSATERAEVEFARSAGASRWPLRGVLDTRVAVELGGAQSGDKLPEEGSSAPTWERIKSNPRLERKQSSTRMHTALSA